GTDDNVIAGNLIGLGADGGTPLGNNGAGLWVSAGNNNRVGVQGDDPGAAAERNVISANSSWGVIAEGTNTVVAGNYIGVAADGTTAQGNGFDGIYVGGPGARIGTDADGLGDDLERNVVSGNTFRGIVLTGSGTSGVTVAGNYVGLAAD